ncbi:hypothetical protein CQ010_01915 [Arthrobacter sp. MYb211]|uniref:mycothiol transferase n=1 Tax=unclassified Arthrobacter TaxID=235627 RepID=UPI000CFC15CD|nr:MULTISPECIES: DUF664 domain-containing protein [unclassified Arthrobacter]PRA13425.1 hypothetical protein CQ015_04170 [Arthrobacter sp. MYb221]PRC10623.1 hypothetical protein CQ010_01915 [Arthrobacter sp. MYb211]
MPSHSPSEQILVQLLLEKFDQIIEIIAQLPEELSNTRPGIPGGNSPIQLLVHCCGMMRRWSSTVNLGVAIPRDRAAEFTATLPTVQALAHAAAVRAEFAADLAQTEMQASPASLPAGREDEYFAQTCQGVLLHVLEEFCQHLGHLEITRDLLLAG